MHTALGMAALAADGLWNGKLDCVPDNEHDVVHGRVGQAGNIYSVWNYWYGSNFTVPDLQACLF